MLLHWVSVRKPNSLRTKTIGGSMTAIIMLSKIKIMVSELLSQQPSGY